MPPGNNSAKPVVEKCTFCRRATCKGNKCRIPSFGTVDEIRRPYPNDLFGREYSSQSHISAGSGGVTAIAKNSEQRRTDRNEISSYGGTKGTYYAEPRHEKTLQEKNSFDPNLATTAHASGSTTLRSESIQSKPHCSHEGAEPGVNLAFAEATTGTETASQRCSDEKALKSDHVIKAFTSEGSEPKASLPKLQGNLGLVKESSFRVGVHVSNKSCDRSLQNEERNISSSEGIERPVSSKTLSVVSNKSSDSDVDKSSDTRKKILLHSPKALPYVGVVYEIVDSRNARVRVAEKNGVPMKKADWGRNDVEHKFAQLLVGKLKQEGLESFHPPNTPIMSVLNKGDIIYLICTVHNKPTSGFHLFAHEAWKTGLRTKANKNDADSVVSCCSAPGSETQGSNSSRTRRRRRRNDNKNSTKEIFDTDSYDVHDAVNQWLDKNEQSPTIAELPKVLKLIDGCHYIGKVIELRLPFAFVVEVSSIDGKQCIFIFSSHFHPQGAHSPCVPQGASIKSLVDVGDEIVVIPMKNSSMQGNKFEWVAKKAWLKSADATIANESKHSKKSAAPIHQIELSFQQENKNIGKNDTLSQSPLLIDFKCSSTNTRNWNELNGVILSLQYDWGLVKEAVGNGSAYVFTRENAFLFGLSLQHFILDDVLKEGQLVKFSLESGESGVIAALKVWCGNPLLDFYSFETAIDGYCQERKIQFTVEGSLIHHGKQMFSEM